MCKFNMGYRYSLITGAMALSMLLLTACHDDDTAPNNANVRITFPPPVSLTDADTIVVRGTAGAVTALRVNGIEADSSDGYATWSVELALNPGENVLTVEANAGKWNKEHAVASLVVTQNAMAAVNPKGGLSLPNTIVPDFINRRILVVNSLGLLKQVSMATGDRRVIADNNTGAGPDILSPAAIALDAANNRVLVLDEWLDALLEVDLSTGDRSVISDAVTGAGPIFDVARPLLSLALDLAHNRALVSDNSLGALLAVDLDSGDRSIISDSVTGNGPAFAPVLSIVSDLANNRALIGDLSGLLAVDLATGDRTPISNNSRGTGPLLYYSASIALDAGNDRVLVANFDFDRSSLLEVDLVTGDRTVIADNYSVGTGPDFDFLGYIALDAANNRLLAVNSTSDSFATNMFSVLYAIDLVNGQRVIWAQ
jgi:DNA-binding beta-propeller fold protein YncE